MLCDVCFVGCNMHALLACVSELIFTVAEAVFE